MPENKRTDITPLPVPFMIQLHPSNSCNSNCLFCWRHNFPDGSQELPDERWLEIVDEICSLQVHQIVINGGGEPLIRSGLVLQMMEKFSKTDIEGTLITNGMLITEEFARKIVELQWKSVQVSIHAPTAQLNDFLMGTEGAFNLALRGIKNINTCKRLRKSAFPELTQRIVITRFNFSTLPDYIRFAKSQGAKWVAVRMVTEGEDNKKECSLSGEEWQQFEDVARRAAKMAKTADIFLHFEFEMELLPHGSEATHHSASSQKKHKATCPLPFCELAIFANGTAGPCAWFKSEKQRAGWLEDVTHQRLSKIWQNGFAALRSSFSEDRPCQRCKNCSMGKNHPVISFLGRRFDYFRNRGEYREGIEFCLELLNQYPDNPLIYNCLGEFHGELEESDEVIHYFSKAVGLGGIQELGEYGLRLHFELAKCYLKKRDYKNALKYFKLNLSKSTFKEDRLHTLYFLAVCHWRLGQLNEMKHYLDKVKKFDEQWPARFFHEGFRHLREHNQFKEGIEFGKQQLKDYPDSAALHHHLGEFHMELGEYDKAIQHLTKAIQLDPKMEWTHFSLGKCLYLAGRHKKAEKAFRDNLRLTSDKLSHYHAWLFLAMATDARDDQAGCRKALQSLKDFKEFIGEEIPLEQVFLARLEKEKHLPPWLKKAKEDNNNRKEKETRSESRIRVELERIKNIKSDNWSEKADPLKALAIKLIKDDKKEECSRVLDLAREEIVKGSGVVGVVEKPQELCEIARLYSDIRRPDKAEGTIKMALQMLEAVKEDCPWKFTNNLCYVAHTLAQSRGGVTEVKDVLHRAIKSLDDIDAHYLERKKEIFSYLKRFSEDKHVRAYLDFNQRTELVTDVPPHEPPENVHLHKFFNDKEIEELKSAVEKNLGNKEISRVLSSINERWRRAVALAILSRLFLKKSKVRRAVEILNIASKESREVEFYWVRDNALEIISGTFLEIYHKNRDNALIDTAENVISAIKDPWKKARALCRIARTLIREERFEQAAQELNYVHSHLLDRIDYRDRTAMSMLLIAEVFEKIEEKKRANTLRNDAFSILDSFDPKKRKGSLVEYEGFISLRTKAHQESA